MVIASFFPRKFTTHLDRLRRPCVRNRMHTHIHVDYEPIVHNFEKQIISLSYFHLLLISTVSVVKPSITDGIAFVYQIGHEIYSLYTVSLDRPAETLT